MSGSLDDPLAQRSADLDVSAAIAIHLPPEDWAEDLELEPWDADQTAPAPRVGGRP